MGTDTGNDYLEEKTQVKVHIASRSEFGPLKDHILITNKIL